MQRRSRSMSVWKTVPFHFITSLHWTLHLMFTSGCMVQCQTYPLIPAFWQSDYMTVCSRWHTIMVSGSVSSTNRLPQITRIHPRKAQSSPLIYATVTASGLVRPKWKDLRQLKIFRFDLDRFATPEAHHAVLAGLVQICGAISPPVFAVGMITM